MNISEWEIGLALLAVALVVGWLSRWWHRRQLQALQQQMARLETSQQTALRMGAQARKQVEELQRLVAEYRRRIAAAAARPPLPAVVEVADVAMQDIESAASAPPPSRLPPGGWADTQPM